MPRLFFDTETTGLVDFKAPVDAKHQPYICQLAAILDDDYGNLQGSMNVLIIPEGFEIEEGSYIHKQGITHTRASTYGVKIKMALGIFHNLWRQANLLVGHNIEFDIRMLLCQYMRNGVEKDFRYNFPFYCTMKGETTNICKIPAKFGYKWPTLDEAYRILIDPKGFDNAHDAMADVLACRTIFYELQSRRAAKGGKTQV